MWKLDLVVLGMNSCKELVTSLDSRTETPQLGAEKLVELE
jgi:hypothetical protein